MPSISRKSSFPRERCTVRLSKLMNTGFRNPEQEAVGAGIPKPSSRGGEAQVIPPAIAATGWRLRSVPSTAQNTHSLEISRSPKARRQLRADSSRGRVGERCSVRYGSGSIRRDTDPEAHPPIISATRCRRRNVLW